MSLGDFCMQLRLFLAFFTSLLIVAVGIAQAQTPGTGTVTISGSEQGPIYPCGNTSCPTYDSGQITITVNGFNASTKYSHAGGQKTSQQLANFLAAKLNTATPSGPNLTGGSGGSAPVGTVTKQTSNNTSLCSSSSDPGGNLSYCSAFFNGFNSNPNDSSAETLVPAPPAGHVSNISLKQLMYPGWTGRMICEYQPWFGLSSHKSVGYNENSSATVGAQDSFMIAEGCDINLIDWYGSLDPNQSFNLTTANTVFADLNTRTGYPLKFGILEDKGALKSTCPTSGQTETATVSCLQNALITEMDYVNANYANSPVYWTDAGQPVIAYFGGKSDWPILISADWDSVWAAVKAHTDTYSTPFKYVFQFGSFTANAYDSGRYGWVQPPAYSSTQQFWWGSSTSANPVYLDNFYSAGLSHPSQLTIGALYKGFDDYNASWSANRVVGQQCGQVLFNTANEISKYFGGSNPQIPYVQVITWNDYEEGTAAEDGVDNCYTVNSSISGNNLMWSL